LILLTQAIMEQVKTANKVFTYLHRLIALKVKWMHSPFNENICYVFLTNLDIKSSYLLIGLLIACICTYMYVDHIL